MADDRYRDNSSSGTRRTSSIFSDDDAGSAHGGGGAWKPEEYGWGRSGGDRSAERGGSGGGRGFFERARDEVGNWLGGNDDGARSSPERSRYGGGQSGFGGEHYRSNRSGADWEGGSGAGGSSSAGYVGREQSNTSHFDENYRRWREQQIARLDQEYEEYCRERQQRFETDFHSWREARQSRPDAAQGSEGGAEGLNETSASRSAMLGGSEPGMHEAGEETTGGGDASAMESSTGSSPDTGADGQGRY